jgi:hypothetical protein
MDPSEGRKALRQRERRTRVASRVSCIRCSAQAQGSSISEYIRGVILTSEHLVDPAKARNEIAETSSSADLVTRSRSLVGEDGNDDIVGNNCPRV